jgi:hypothetical protein
MSRPGLEFRLDGQVGHVLNVADFVVEGDDGVETENDTVDIAEVGHFSPDSNWIALSKSRRRSLFVAGCIIRLQGAMSL